jgi:hypothetical protein
MFWQTVITCEREDYEKLLRKFFKKLWKSSVSLHPLVLTEVVVLACLPTAGRV